MHRRARIVLDLLATLPGGPELLGVADRIPGLWLVGGAVRDALLEAPVRDLDVAVEGPVGPVARALGEVVEEHERFGTAEVALPDGAKVNLARTRTETYACPGALPDVHAATLDEDLGRRDFTINAIAVGLSAPVRGELRSPDGALDDVLLRRLRVLHDASFSDDPTRLLRMARYVARLGLEVEEHTAGLARAATLEHVSGPRVGAEVRLLLAEADAVRALLEGALWGGEAVPLPGPEVAPRALRLLPADGRADLLVLASGRVEGLVRAGAARDASEVARAGAALMARLRELGFTAAEVERAGRSALAPGLAAELSRPGPASQVAAAARGWPVEAVALAGALGPGAAAAAWLDDLRHVRLAISGHDLVRAGVPEGPEVGERLGRALAARLDGLLAPGPEAELAAALADYPR